MDLSKEEATVLHEVLTSFLSDLRMEVSGTEDYDLRQRLKRDEEIIKGLIARLEKSEALAA